MKLTEKDSKMLFVGIEGGATHCTGVVVNEKGEALAHGEGLDTNVWIIGVPELINRLESLLKDLMSQLGASEGTVFDAIGLSISGGSQPKMAENIKSQLKVIFALIFASYLPDFYQFDQFFTRFLPVFD
jgi:N-acetylglucosamine kinase-like BadF-type ATPase